MILEEIGTSILSLLPQVLISLLAIITGYLFIRFIKNTIDNRMKEQRLGEHLAFSLITLIRWMVILIVASIVLYQFGFNLAAITGFISVIGGTVIGFAAINTLGNSIAGFIIMISRPFKVGDRILFNGRFFDVITINLIYTKLRTLDLVYVSVPNQELLKKEIDNYGKKNILRQSVKITVGYDEPREFITRVLLEAVDRVPLVLKAPLPFVSITDFQNYAMEYTLFYFIRQVKRIPWIEADVRSNIVDTFHENGIDLTTPFLSTKPEDVVNKDRTSLSAIKDEETNVSPNDIRSIEGIGAIYSEKLNSVYIYTVGDLLESGKSREGRSDLAEKTGIPAGLILRWVNLADLFRVEGIGSSYSALLELCGVDTVIDLSRRNPVNLHRRLVEENETRNLVKKVPSFEMIDGWIQDAKNLPRKITY